MAHFFLDTSALVKRFYEERGTEIVDDIVEDTDSDVFITSLSVIEAVSALRRKRNTGEISEEEMYGLVSAFFEEALKNFVILPMEEVTFEYSFPLVLEDNLRTLDSLQLSAALSLDFDNLHFVCADRDLIEVADKRELETINPEEAA